MPKKIKPNNNSIQEELVTPVYILFASLMNKVSDSYTDMFLYVKKEIIKKHLKKTDEDEIKKFVDKIMDNTKEIMAEDISKIKEIAKKNGKEIIDMDFDANYREELEDSLVLDDILGLDIDIELKKQLNELLSPFIDTYRDNLKLDIDTNINNIINDNDNVYNVKKVEEELLSNFGDLMFDTSRLANTEISRLYNKELIGTYIDDGFSLFKGVTGPNACKTCIRDIKDKIVSVIPNEKYPTMDDPGSYYSINESAHVIPRHPFCGCIWIPYIENNIDV